MAERLNTATPADLEIRGDGRTVVGIACPFDQEIALAGQVREVFRHGAFTRTIAERGPERVKFLAAHDQQALPLGRAVSLVEDAAGLRGEFRVSKTERGDEVLELIRDGALDGLSIGFRPIRHTRSSDGFLIERTEVRLDEVSAVTFPAYETARVAALRNEAGVGLDNYHRRLRLLAARTGGAHR